MHLLVELAGKNGSPDATVGTLGFASARRTRRQKRRKEVSVLSTLFLVILLVLIIFVWFYWRHGNKNIVAEKEPLPVVLLHGWGASNLIFERIIIPRMQKMGANYRFIAFDLPGHGKNGKIKAPKDLKRAEVIPHMVDSIMKDIDNIGIKEFALVGYSFGATLALHIAAQHPDRVKALIVNDPIINGKAFEAYRRIGFHVLYNALKPIGETRAILKIINNNHAHDFARRVLPVFFQHTRPDESELAKQIDDIKEYDKRNTNPRFWAAGMDALFSHNAEFTAMHVKCPILIMTGDSVPYEAADTGIRLQQLIGACGRSKQVVQMFVVKNSGHHILSTNPDEFCSQALKFLYQNYS